MLGAHSRIATASEPWLLLPLIGTYTDLRTYASYGYPLTMKAIGDFANTLDEGAQAYKQELRQFVTALYHRATPPGKEFFVDKTPRYSIIAPHIVELFPNAKHIILWRSPVAVATSIVTTFRRNVWDLFGYQIDLRDGLEGLLEARTQIQVPIYTLRYEDLIQSPAETMTGVLEFLGLEYESRVIDSFSSVELQGRMGDPTGRYMYHAVSDAPLTKWMAEIGNPLRKSSLRNYIRWIGETRLNLMGYSESQLLREIDAVPSNLRHLFSDVTGSSVGYLKSLGRRYLSGNLIELARPILQQAEVFK